MDGSTNPYGLRLPTVDDARAAVLRVHGGDGPRIWDGLAAAGAVGLDRLLAAMEAADPTTRLCALALRIRVGTHAHLSVAHGLTRS